MVDDRRSSDRIGGAPSEEDDSRTTSHVPAAWTFVASAAIVGALLLVSAALL
jgi:hypothetical protein